MTKNAQPLPTPEPGKVARMVSPGGHKLRTGWCGHGPADPAHQPARCSTLTWSPSKPGWVACSCECHDADLDDPELLTQLAAEAYEREYRWRAEHAGVLKPKRRTVSTSEDDGGASKPKGAPVRQSDDELRAFVSTRLGEDPAVSMWALIREWREQGKSIGTGRFRRLFEEARAGK